MGLYWTQSRLTERTPDTKKGMLQLPIRHDRKHNVTYGTVETLSPGLRRITCNNPNPFTFTGTGTYLVGTGQVAIIDPGPNDPEHLNAICQNLKQSERVSHIFVTHRHEDHCGGARALAQRLHTPIVGWPLHDEVSTSPETGHGSATEEATDRTLRLDHEIHDGEIISGSDWKLKAIHTPGHVREHVCYELLDSGMAFSGDHVMAWATSVIVPPNGSISDYLKSLRRLQQITSINTLLPTHGPAVQEADNYIEALIQHREARHQQVLELVEGGISRIADIVPVIYANYDRNLWFAAAATVHAHLIAAVDAGEVAVVDDDSPQLGSLYESIEN